MTITLRADCRCCRRTQLHEVFDLGVQPYANAFLTAEQLLEPQPACPLRLKECNACGHVQLGHVIAAHELYRTYSFLTSSSQRMSDHFASLMRINVDRFVPRNGLVVEIGSNDGTALASIVRADVRRIGIDPALNLAKLATQRDVWTFPEFFSESVGCRLAETQGRADLIVACNVLGHVDDLDDFCRGIMGLLSETGALIVEVPSLDQLLKHTAFDTIYHEHLSYFSVGSLSTLLARHQLDVLAIEPQDVHGGSLRVTIRKRLLGEPRDVVTFGEHHSTRDWDGFQRRCQTLRYDLLHWLSDQAESGRVVWGYGAPAKASVLLNYCDIGCDLLPVVVDSTPIKQGRYMPGTQQPILPPEELQRAMPDAALVLAWNHFAEIQAKETEYLQAGGELVAPFETHLSPARLGRGTDPSAGGTAHVLENAATNGFDHHAAMS